MSTAAQPGAGARRPRKPRRAALRTWYWVMERLKNAESGDAALSDMWRWTRALLAAIGEQRPEAAEAARWELARQLAAFNARLDKARIPLRAGLTEQEEHALLNPWSPREEDHR